VQHSSLPRILDSGEYEDRVYLATEPIEGRSLQDLIAPGDGIAPMRAIRMLGEIADALDAAHAAGVEHAGLTPESVVVEDHAVGRVVLRDFQLGREESPEGDIRSFAALMFECFTGYAPSGRPASEVRSGLPAQLDAVLARGLSEYPRRPPTSAAQLVADAAKAVMAAAPAPTPAPATEVALAEGATFERTDGVPTRRRVRGTNVRLLAAALLAAGAAVGGWMVGRPEPAADTPAKVDSGTIELALPAGWSQTGPARGLGGLAVRDAVAGAGTSGSRVEAGLVSGTLPSRVAGRVGLRPGRPDAVELGDLQAYRWRGLTERGTRTRITLFAAGTEAGIVALACHGGVSAIEHCERAAGSLAVSASLPARLSALDTWDSRLDRVMSRLARRRHRDRASLAKAKTPRSLSHSADRLASDFSAARRSISAHAAPTGATVAQRKIVSTLSWIAAAYRRLGSAARRQKSAAYRSASRSISRRERDLERTLRGL
jgi:serine/threonine protein kinase